MKQNQWIVSGKTGISSKTMWAAINGAIDDNSNLRKGFNFDIPYDPADFRRCYEYVLETNVTKEQLETVKITFKWFAPFIDNWDELVSLYESEKGLKSMKKTYKYIQKLGDESRVLDGWVKISNSSWERLS